MGSLRAPSSVVVARKLTYRYPSGRRGVSDVSLTVAPGDRVVVMGPNGSGKSSLLRLLSCELRPSGGSLEVLGRAADAVDAPLRRGIGVAGDRPVHLDPLTGRSNALLFARAAGLPAPLASGRVDALLARFDLTPVAGVPVEEYSLGMRRKLLLVEALAHEPPLLLLDEPTQGLDPPAVEALVDLVASAARRHAAVLVATNDLAAAPLLGDRIVFLDEGRVVADAPPRDLLGAVAGGTTVQVELADPPGGIAEALPAASVDVLPDGIVARLPGGSADIPALVEALVAAGAGIRRLEVREPHLGDAFRVLTGGELPESDPVPGAEG